MSQSLVPHKVTLTAVDPCQILPVDVLEVIFSNISMDQIIISCMLVSRHWRYQFGQCTILWRKYVIGPDEIRSICPKTLSTDILGPHVHHIEKHYIKPNTITLLFTLISKHKFPTLKSLSVSGDYLSPLTRLSSYLVQFPKSLRFLKLDCINDPSISLFVILKAFPGLSTLVYRNIYSLKGYHQHADIDPDTNAMEGYTAVKTTTTNLLALELTMTSISSNTQAKMLEAILQICPLLRGLTIAPCKHVELLLELILQQKPRYCPHLSFLTVNALHCLPNLLDRVCQQQQSAGGLIHLSIGHSLVPELERLLMQHQSTLQELSVYLETCHEYGYVSAYTFLDRKSMQFSRLRELKFHGRIDTTAKIAFLDAILASARNLESLTIANYASFSPPLHITDLFHRLKTLPFLKHIDLSCYTELPGLSTVYLDHMVTLGDMCPLRTFRLTYGPITPSLVERLGQIKTLEHVALVPAGYYNNDGDSGHLIELLTYSRSIQSITLDSKLLADKAVIGQLARIKPLRQLTVSGRIDNHAKALLSGYAKTHNLSIQFIDSPIW